MTQLSTSLTPEISPVQGVHGLGRLYLELTKARLSFLVVVTSAVGYLAGARGVVDWAIFLWTVIGTSLAAACANAMNQVIEADRDALMPRTAGRPVPSGRMGPMHASIVAVVSGGVGLTILAALVNGLTAGLGVLTIGLYLLVYTPMKVRSTLNTLAGAVVGAIPPVMGWTAARGTIDAGAWALAAILFVWQIPHFLSLAWMYKHDYELGGYRMLPNVDDEAGSITRRTVLMWSAALLPIGLSAAWVGITGYWYAICSVLLGVWILVLALRFYRDPQRASAKKLFLASVIYLPLVMLAIVLDPPVEPSLSRGNPSSQPVVMAPESATPAR